MWIVLQARTASGAPLASVRTEVREGRRLRPSVELHVPPGTARVALYLMVGERGVVAFEEVELEAVE